MEEVTEGNNFKSRKLTFVSSGPTVVHCTLIEKVGSEICLLDPSICC